MNRRVNTVMMAMNKLIKEIQIKFSDGCPNGFLLGWDVNRFFQSLISLYAGLKVINDTDFNYSYCNSYDIELGRSDDGDTFVLTLKASFIVNAFAIHVTKYSNNKKSGKVVPIQECAEYESEIEKARSFMERQSFTEIQESDMKYLVENVDLELAERATVGKCLFDDFE